MTILAILLVSIGIGLVGFYAVSLALTRTGNYRHLLAFRGATDTQTNPWERRALRLFGRFLSLDEWERRLQWAQRYGRLEGVTLGRIAFQGLAGGVGGLLIALLGQAPIWWLLPALGLVLPWVRLYSASEDAKEATARDLPIVAALVAAELAAGTPPETAVERAATLPGPLAGLLKDAITFARETGRPLFASPRGPIQGALVDVFTRPGVPALAAFARQLNLVAVKGTEGAFLMSGIAQSLADEYQAQLERRIKQLDARIWPIIALFFFFPFVGLLLLVNLIPALSLF